MHHPVCQGSPKVEMTGSDLSWQVLEHGQASYKSCPDIGPKKGTKCQQMYKAQSFA